MCLSDPATAGRLCPGPGRLVRAVSWPGAPSLCPSLACSSSAAVRTQVLGQPLRHASNKQQTVEGFMLSTRTARAPGLLCGQRGSGEGPGPSQAVTVLSQGAVCTGVPGRALLVVLDPRARRLTASQHPCPGPHPASQPGPGPETASCSGSLWVLQAVSGTLGAALIKSL